MNLKYLSRWLSVAVFLSVFYGCGYHFHEVGSLEGGFSSISIPLIKSPSSAPGFESEITEIIRREFITRSRIPLVSQGKAEAVLVGEVTEIRTEPLTFRVFENTVGGTTTRFEATSSRRLVMKMSAKLLGPAGEPVWEERDLEEKAAFEVSVDPLETEFNQTLAVREIALRFAKRLYQNTIERF